MTDEEFRDHLDRYGGDLALWPPPAARDARRLLLRSVPAQKLLDEATAIELALSRPDADPPSGLADRIFDAAFRSEPSDRGFDEDVDQPRRLM